jgi:uncharacterized membrane protein YcaP (DUF421 family)
MNGLFGSIHNVTLPQECARAVLVFIYGYVLLRLAGRRSFGKWAALDFIIQIVVGSALARVITGDATIDGTFAATAIMVGMHFCLSWTVAHNDSFSHPLEGRTIVLSEGSHIDQKARKAHLVSTADLGEALRAECLGGLEDLEKTKRLHLEPSGKISVVKKEY